MPKKRESGRFEPRTFCPFEVWTQEPCAPILQSSLYQRGLLASAVKMQIYIESELFQVSCIWKNISFLYPVTCCVLWKVPVKQKVQKVPQVLVTCFLFLVSCQSHDNKLILVGLYQRTLCSKPALIPLHQRGLLASAVKTYIESELFHVSGMLERW